MFVESIFLDILICVFLLVIGRFLDVFDTFFSSCRNPTRNNSHLFGSWMMFFVAFDVFLIKQKRVSCLSPQASSRGSEAGFQKKTLSRSLPEMRGTRLGKRQAWLRRWKMVKPTWRKSKNMP